jgi:lipopolysaccharide export system protein LptA
MRRAALALAAALAPAIAIAEKADKDKPTQIESNRMSSDDSRRINIFEGNVVLTKGTILVRADRIVVRQDADGFQFTTATGNPVRFRQRGDPKPNQEGAWMDGEALRVEIDDRNEKVELYDKARVTRDQDEVRGNFIFLDQRSEFFSVSGSKDAPAASPEGRVRAVLQPKSAPPEPPKARP